LISRIFNALFSAGLNLSSPEPLTQSPENNTIQNFVKGFVDEYISEYADELTRLNFFYDFDIFLLALSFFHFQGELNLSLSQPSQPQNNRTLQSFIEAYLGKHTGGLMYFY